MEVLVSTMNQNDYSLIDKMNINSNAIIINQCGENSIKDLTRNNNQIKWINSDEIGLSNSRNMAIKSSTKDICLLADDDLEYIDNYQKIILKQFKLYPNADIITFKVEGINSKFKNYYSKTRKLNYLTSMKVSSVEIAFRTNSIKRNNIKFNKLFGAGSKYYAGEECIFLTDCLKKGLKIRYVPIKIANLYIGNSTWFKGYKEDFFITKGAVFAAMSKWFSIPYILQFALRKYKLYSKEITMITAIDNMLKGRRKYLNEIR